MLLNSFESECQGAVHGSSCSKNGCRVTNDLEGVGCIPVHVVECEFEGTLVSYFRHCDSLSVMCWNFTVKVAVIHRVISRLGALFSFLYVCAVWNILMSLEIGLEFSKVVHEPCVFFLAIAENWLSRICVDFGLNLACQIFHSTSGEGEDIALLIF